MTDLGARHQRFWDLHQAGCFMLPNPWDAGSARMMAAMGARALATSSAAHAFTLGRADMGGVSRDEALDHAAQIVAAVGLPVSGDFENGFGDAPEVVAETVRLSAEVGLSGISIEDTQMSLGNPAYDFDLAIERVRAGAAVAREIERRFGRPFVFCARADGVMNGVYDLAEGIRRLQAFQAVGADVLYLPIPPDLAGLRQILASVTAPVNVLAAGAMRAVPVAELAALGVRRISTGSMIARMTHGVIRDAMAGLMAGDLTVLQSAMSGDAVNEMLKVGAGV